MHYDYCFKMCSHVHFDQNSQNYHPRGLTQKFILIWHERSLLCFFPSLRKHAKFFSYKKGLTNMISLIGYHLSFYLIKLCQFTGSKKHFAYLSFMILIFLSLFFSAKKSINSIGKECKGDFSMIKSSQDRSKNT